MRIVLTFLFTTVVSTSLLFSQAFLPSLNQTDSVNFYSIVKDFDTYWEGKKPGKGEGYKPFKRWEHFWSPRVYPTGKFPAANVLYKEQQAYNLLYKGREQQLGSAWEELGPRVVPTNKLEYNSSGAGRINCIEVDPTNKNILWAGSAAGGLWTSKDAGKNWSSNTDLLPTLGVTDIAIHPTNPSIMYIATGDGFGGHTNSLGVMKSIDKGLTWQTTGLTADVENGLRINRLLIDPINPNILIAATSNGVYRTENSGQDWFLSKSGWYIDAEFKPTDPNTVYLGEFSWNGRAAIHVSNDNGKNFQRISTGLPQSNSLRIELAVSNAEPDLVIAVIARANDRSFLGFYVSYDAGITWELQSSTPNILTGSVTGANGSGQSQYNLSLAIANEYPLAVFVGGVNLWKSNDLGVSWSINAHWTGAGGANFVHADHHNLEFVPNSNILYDNNDGGISFSTNLGVSWTDVSSGLGVTQFYRIGVTEQNPNLIIGGTQDNGTHIYRNGVWTHNYGGDGMDCAIDPVNQNVMYASVYYAKFFRSDNGGNTFFEVTGGLPTGAWVAPLEIDPVNPATIYIGNRQVYKSTNRGNDWTNLSGTSFSNEFVEFISVSKSDNDVIYAASTRKLLMTLNGGSTWLNRTNGLPNLSITSIKADFNDPTIAYATFSGYAENVKVYKTENAGSTWTNFSTGLPNVPCNTIVLEENSDMGIMFVGTDLGVFFRTKNSSSWLPYNNGLPNVVINDLEIIQNSTPKYLVAGTFGRGIWRSPLEVSGKPVSQFSSSSTNVCAGNSITLSEQAGNTPTLWKWLLPGSSNTIVTTQSATVSYPASGTYDVTLITTNSFGSDTLTKKNYITVIQKPTPMVLNSTTTACQYSQHTYKTNRIAGRSYKWEAIGGTIMKVSSDSVIVYWNEIGNHSIKLTETIFSSGCSDVIEVAVIVTPSLNKPTITVQGKVLTASTGSGYQWFRNGIAIAGATEQTYEFTIDGTYTVKLRDPITNCDLFSDPYSTITSVNDAAQYGFKVSPNPTNNVITLRLDNDFLGTTTIDIVDIKSRIIKDLGTFEINGVFQHQIDCSHFASGTYYLRIQLQSGKTIVLPFIKL